MMREDTEGNVLLQADTALLLLHHRIIIESYSPKLDRLFDEVEKLESLVRLRSRFSSYAHLAQDTRRGVSWQPYSWRHRHQSNP